MERTCSRQDQCLPGATARGGHLAHRLLLSVALLGTGYLELEHASAQVMVPQQAGTPQSRGTSVDVGTVPVTAPALNSDGSTAASGGMYVPAPTFGPLGPTPAQDNPFSTNSFPQQLIRDQQARTLSEIARNDPSYGTSLPPSVTGYSNFFIRGFPTDNPTNNRIDGLPVATNTGILLQDYERVDIYKGLSGLLYGFTSPGGLINYISKLPLSEPLTEISGSYLSNSNFNGAADVSRRFGPDNQFGIRINLAGGGGGGPVDHTSNADYVGAIALDWKPAPNTRFWFNSSYSKDAYYGTQPVVLLGAFRPPPAPDSGRFYGVPFSEHIGTTRGYEGGFETEITPWLSARGTVGNFLARRDVRYNGANLTDDLGNYTLTIDPHNHFAISDTSGEFIITPHFTTGIFTNKTDIGITANEETVAEHNVQRLLTFPGISSFYSPISITDPNEAYVPNSPFNSTQDYRNYLLQETLDIGRYVTVIGAVAHSTIRYSDDQAAQDAYNQSATTPSAGIVIKPTSKLSFYGSFIQGLQPGAQAGQTLGNAPVLNAFATLPAFVATQYEVGIEYQVNGGLQVNLALFRIAEPSAIYQPTNAAATSYTFTDNGEQVNRGIEVTTVGRLTEDLSIFGGLT